MKLYISPHGSLAEIEVRNDGAPHLEIRVWAGGSDGPIALDAWKPYANRRVPETTAAQVEMLEKLSPTMRKSSPLHWSFLYLDHVRVPGWLFRLQHAAGSRAAELDGVPAKRINSALRNARQALGLERGAGRTRRGKP